MNRDKRTKNKDKRTKTKEQRQKSKDKRAKTKEQRQKSKDQRQKNKDVIKPFIHPTNSPISYSQIPLLGGARGGQQWIYALKIFYTH